MDRGKDQRGPRRDDQRRKPDYSPEEIDAERGAELPDREALSVLRADVAIPVDPEIAAEVLAGDDPPEEDEPEGEGSDS